MADHGTVGRCYVDFSKDNDIDRNQYAYDRSGCEDHPYLFHIVQQDTAGRTSHGPAYTDLPAPVLHPEPSGRGHRQQGIEQHEEPQGLPYKQFVQFFNLHHRFHPVLERVDLRHAVIAELQGLPPLLRGILEEFLPVHSWLQTEGIHLISAVFSYHVRKILYHIRYIIRETVRAHIAYDSGDTPGRYIVFMLEHHFVRPGDSLSYRVLPGVEIIRQILGDEH